ncbi:MAG: sugar phosphate isomerase/epimerase family protein [Planctomycetaceae bacterium]|nr:sugar phosphate isomerase/epimerase family protein [Planctomycetaceae bacterium]
MLLGYNTNGLAHHRWDDAIELIAAAGYRSAAITVDHHCLDPASATFRTDLARMSALLERCRLRCVIETGARFLLNPARKHQPTLLSPTAAEREIRLRFLRQCIDIAAELRADAVSFWSGAAVDAAHADVLWERLVEGCRRLADHADARDVRLAFEPEPGMFLETRAQYRQLRERVNHSQFGLTLDVGHVHCLQDGSIADHIREFAPVLFNIHIEDMLPGEHEHLRFGAGTIDVFPIFRALHEVRYAGGVHVELSRHSHIAPVVLRESLEFLSRQQAAAESRPT